MSTIRVLLVDDHVVLRRGLRQLLSLYADMDVVGEAGSGEEAFALIDEVAPGVVLMDVDMPGRGGIATTALIHAVYPRCRILLLTGYARYAAAGIQAGARGYILKHAGDDEIAEAIRAVYQGGVYLDTAIQGAVVTALQQGSEPTLSARQLAIIRFMADGVATREIGDALGLSEPSVKQHIAVLLDQLEAKDRAHAVAIALKRGLL